MAVNVHLHYTLAFSFFSLSFFLSLRRYQQHHRGRHWPTNSCGKYRMLRQGWSQERNVAREHITPTLRQLHWLPVRRRVEFKMASLVYQVLSSKVPGYLADDIHLASESSARSLRSCLERKCSVTCVHSRFGDRCFAAAGPRIWNNLPASLRDKEVSCTEFRRQLKTFMFQMDCGASWLLWLLRLINTLTYLPVLTINIIQPEYLFPFHTINILTILV